MESNEQADAEPRFGLHGVTLLHGQRHIIQDVTLAILPGEFHALIGSRNSGKSAVAAVLAGSLPFASGTVLLNGRHHAQVTGRLARQAGVNVVSGVPKVFQKLTVAENLLSGEPLWRRALRSWRGFLRDIQAWLTHSGIDLPLFQTLDSMPPEDWIFVELLGRLYRSPRLLIMDEALESLAPARRRILMPVLRKRMAEGMAVLWITHKIEDAMLMTDRLSVIRNGKLLLSASSGDLDQLTLIQLCYSQIEERDETDATMEQFRQLMRFTGALIRDLPQAVAILDMERRVRFLNRRASLLFADGPDNGMGSRLDELLGTANRQHADTVLLAMDQSGEGEWHNLPIRHANGEMLADVILRRILEHARPVGYMVQIEDVSAREELRRRLILSENLAAVGLLAAGVAHEVNNPLEIIGNYLAYLKKMTGDADTRNVLRKIEEEGARIQQIVNNLIVFSGNARDADTLVDVPALCLELCGLLRFHNRDRRIAFICPKPQTDLRVRADPNEMRQVLLNLFRNSIAVLADGGRIEVDFSQCGPARRPLLEMRFSDNGPGIARDNPDEIFLPFVTTRSQGGKNHGLGLFIVYGIIEKYGGSITVENLPDAGCRFTITLPLANAGPPPGKTGGRPGDNGRRTPPRPASGK